MEALPPFFIIYPGAQRTSKLVLEGGCGELALGKKRKRAKKERSQRNPPQSIIFTLMLRFQNLCRVRLLNIEDFSHSRDDCGSEKPCPFLQVILIGSLPRASLDITLSD